MNQSSKPPSYDYIDLSIQPEIIASMHEKGSKIPSRRDAITAYRRRVENKMSSPDTSVTPWGIWKKGGTGYYIQSSLNNQLLDLELAATMMHDFELASEYKLLDIGSGIPLRRSIMMRKRYGVFGCHHLDRIIQKSSGGNFRTNPGSSSIEITVSDGLEGFPQEGIESAMTGADRELFKVATYNSDPLFNLLIRRSICNVKSGRLFKKGEYKKVRINSNSLLPVSGLKSQFHDYTYTKNWPYDFMPEAKQRFFVSLETLALLCAIPSEDVVVADSENRIAPLDGYLKADFKSPLWFYWSMLCSFSGLYCGAITPHGRMEPSRYLSPSNNLADPIHNIVMGMWAYGAADGFYAELNLNARDRSKRGLYMEFDLHGEGRKKVIKVAHAISDEIDRTVGVGADEGHILELELPDEINALALDNPYHKIKEEQRKNDPLAIFEDAVKEVAHE